MRGRLTTDVSADDLATDAWNRHFWAASRLKALVMHPILFARCRRLVRRLLETGFDVTTCPWWGRIYATRNGERLSGDVIEDRGQIYFGPVNEKGCAFEASEDALDAFEQAAISVGFPRQPLMWFSLSRDKGPMHAVRCCRVRSLCGETWRRRGLFTLTNPTKDDLVCEGCETAIREKGLT